MIDIKITKQGSSIISVECTGHAGYAEAGQDIVCAGISTVVQSTLLGLLQVVGISVDYTVEDNGYLQFILPQSLSSSERHDADILCNTMLASLDDFYTEYSDYINLEVNNVY